MNQRIGLIIPEISDSLEYDLINGIFSEGKKYNCDLLIITGAFNSHSDLQQDTYTSCLENIYELAECGKFDGIIYAAGRFHNIALREKIYSMLKKRNIPCVVLDNQNEDFISIYPKQRESMKMITKHLITEHNCKKLYCITGIEENYDSTERLEGFKEALAESGIETDDKNVFYGGFWKIIPAEIAEKIACGEIEKPDAIVCASDVMAIAVCDTLMKYGIKVPEDIAVTGYDGSWEAYSNIPEITTVYGREYQFGIDAMKNIIAMINGCKPSETPKMQNIRYGTSCGCGMAEHLTEKSCDTSMNRFVKNKINLMTKQKTYIASDINFNMNKCRTLDELVEEIHNFGHLLIGWEWIDICLCEDWQINPERPEVYRQSGFTDNVYLAVSKRFARYEKQGYSFPIANLLPALEKEHEPLIVIFSSLFCNSQILGYIGISYKNPDDICIDVNYLRWCDSFCNALRLLRNRLYSEYYKNQIAVLSTIDLATELLNKRGILEKLPVFIGSSKLKNNKAYLLMFSNIERKTPSSNLVTDDSLIVASALRNSSDKNEICARLSDNIFLIIMTASQQSNLKTIIQKRMILLEKELLQLYKNIQNAKIPDFITEEYDITNESPLEFDKLIDELQTTLSDNSEAAANRYYDYKEQLNRLRRNIYLNPQREWNVDDMAADIGISRSHLQRMYKSQFIVSCHDDIINARMEKAKRLLISSNLHIQEIAYLCGYNNTSHFMKQFKIRFGITAKQFRTDNT